MSIKVIRNEQGNCVQFEGTTLPVYWNACLSARENLDNPNNIDVVNDIETGQTGFEKQEISNEPYTNFLTKDGTPFTSAQEAIEYINANANVTGLTGNGIDLIGEQVCFSLDETSTSIMMDNGFSFGVNTIKAVADADGTVHIISNDTDGNRTHFFNLEVGNACVNGSVISGGLNDIVNTLNELFTVGPFEAVVIADPFSTLVADVGGVDAGYTEEGVNYIDPLGDDLGTNSGSTNSLAGIKSVQTIDQAGEYFTFDIRGKSTYGFGLVHSDASYAAGNYSGNATYADPAGFCVTNNQHSGFQFSHWFHIGNAHASWTNYGANTSYAMGPAWSNNAVHFHEKDDWNSNNPVTMKVGLDANGFIEIASKKDDGTFAVHARSNYPVPDGAEFHLGVKLYYNSARILSEPKVHLLEPEAPDMYFRYIESPDGVFHYPLFLTAEEAEYYDEVTNGLSAGTGSSHTHTYPDDPTNTTWYMPEASHDPGTYQHSAAPDGTETFQSNVINWTEVTSLTNADLAPSQFSNADLTYQEGTVVNIPLSPVDVTYTTSAVISPAGSGLVYNSSTTMLQGTLADVTSDTVYTITVTRANSYGSSVGSFTITATDVPPPQTNDTPWTKALDFSGSSERAQQVSTHSNNMPIAQDNITTTVPSPTAGQTSDNTYSRPWASTVVFKADRHNSNQHVWNQGGGSNDDNIYLRLSASGTLFFGWGRDGSGVNECQIATNIQSSRWYGVYIAHNGARFSGNNASSANLASAFDIRIMSSADSFGSLSANLSTSFVWSGGARMDRNYGGTLTIGGRGSNRSFHGKVASFVSTTLRCGVAMPADAEIEEMITDPIKWMNDTKVGSPYRWASGLSETTFTFNNLYSALSTQIWLMGDGSNDNYSNMIRNRVMSSDQNYTKLNLLSMVSNDIQNVNIPGLT